MPNWIPAVFLLFLAPFCGEILSTSLPPLEFLQFPTIVIQIMLYGCGALLIRELKHRKELNWGGVFLLGCAYGIFEEGIVVRSFFDPAWMDLGIHSIYGRFIGVNWIWTIALIFYHAINSILVPIMITEFLFVKNRNQPWLKRPAIYIASFLFYVMVFFGPLMKLRATWLMIAGCILSMLILILFGFKMKIPEHLSVKLNHNRRFALFILILNLSWMFLYGIIPGGIPSIPAILPFIGLVILTILAGILITFIKTDTHLVYFLLGNMPFWVFFTFIAEFSPDRTDNTAFSSLAGTAYFLFILILFRINHRRVKEMETVSNT